jgi:hypothetical protein
MEESSFVNDSLTATVPARRPFSDALRPPGGLLLPPFKEEKLEKHFTKSLLQPLFPVCGFFGPGR